MCLSLSSPGLLSSVLFAHRVTNYAFCCHWGTPGSAMLLSRTFSLASVRWGTCQAASAPGDTTLHSTLSADRNELIHKPKPLMSVTLGLSWRDDLMISRPERPVKTREKPSTKGRWIILSIQVFILMINGMAIQTMLKFLAAMEDMEGMVALTFLAISSTHAVLH